VKLTRIVVGDDGSPDAAAALAFAVDLAEVCDAEVVAVHAAGLLEGTEGGTAPARASGDRVEHVVRDGDPVSVLLRAADELAAELIVVGSRGMSARPELLLGSTSTQVAQRSTRPVVIVPHTRSGE
jgi:nucleotide-binding universal stress UspA family protein